MFPVFIVESTPSSNANKRTAIRVRCLGSTWYYEREVGRKSVSGKVGLALPHCGLHSRASASRRRESRGRHGVYGVWRHVQAVKIRKPAAAAALACKMFHVKNQARRLEVKYT